jgi:nitrite reductase (NO-forming)
MKKRILALALLATASLTGCSSQPSVEPTGHTTTVTVQVQGMSYTPSEIEVPLGDELVVEFENTGTELHDIEFGNGEASERINPGQTATVDVGVVGEDLEFWCSVSNHRSMGMEGTVTVG